MELDREQMKKRTGLIIIGLSAWALIICVFLFNYTFLQRGKYLDESRKLAWRTGTYSALRGQIISDKGTPLAWSEKKYAIILSRMISVERGKELFQELNAIYPKNYQSLSDVQIPHLLCSGLNPEQVEMAIELQKKYPEIQLTSRVERIVRDEPELRKSIGEVAWINGILTGISGLEKKYNTVLSGKDGTYKVMVSRHGQWIPGSWQVVTPPQNGLNVNLTNAPEKDLSK